MFMRRKNSANISEEEPIFNVRYIGNIETLTATGKGCTVNPLRTLWENAPHEKRMKKITVQISMCGIFMNESEKKSKQNMNASGSNTNNKTGGSGSSAGEGGEMHLGYSKHFSVEDISYCAADKVICERIFCWIHKNPGSGKLYLHAVLCSGGDKAKTMASVMSRVFRLAYTDWKSGVLRAGRKSKNPLLVGSLSGEGCNNNKLKHAQVTPKSSTMKIEMMKMMTLMKEAPVPDTAGSTPGFDESADDNNDDDDDDILDDNIGKDDVCCDDNGLLPAISWSSTESFPSREGDLKKLVT